ncbi:chaperonin GroS [Trichuris suis]|nr:chaperonin GroS [Trichuris suis]
MESKQGLGSIVQQFKPAVIMTEMDMTAQTQAIDIAIDATTDAVRKFTPLFDRLLVERFAPETKTKGGIMIPEKAQGKVLEATVLAAGSGSRTEEGKTIPLTVKVGDRVLLPEYGGTKIVMEEKEYYIFRESDILGKWIE